VKAESVFKADVGQQVIVGGSMDSLLMEMKKEMCTRSR